MNKFRTKVSTQNIRTPLDFFGFDKTFRFVSGAFNLPVKQWDDSSFNQVKDRIASNVDYYFMNYLMVLATITNIMMYCIYFRVTSMAVMAVIGGMWALHMYLAKQGVALVIGQQTLSLRFQRLILAAISITLGILFFLRLLLSGIGTSLLLVGPHALARNPALWAGAAPHASPPPPGQHSNQHAPLDHAL